MLSNHCFCCFAILYYKPMKFKASNVTVFLSEFLLSCNIATYGYFYYNDDMTLESYSKAGTVGSFIAISLITVELLSIIIITV